MKTSKRLLSLLLALTMVLSLMGNLSVAAFAEEVTPTVVTTDQAEGRRFPHRQRHRPDRHRLSAQRPAGGQDL